MKLDDDGEKFLSLAIEQAKTALIRGEVPIGAVIVRGGRVISKAFNMRERKQNALAHAEIIAIHKACRKLRSWRLDDCVMYVTLQPCPMCAGAILNARIKKVFIGAEAPNCSLEIYKNNNLNWATEAVLCGDDICGDMLREFFKRARKTS